MSESETLAPGKDATVTLREVTKETSREIMKLKVSPEQEQFVAPNVWSIAQAYFDRETAWFRGVYADDAPVGFVMLSDDPTKEEYFLWRFMIDARYQGHGFGRRAIELLIEYVKTRPGAKTLLVSCVPGDGSPCPFYERLGFVYTGEVDEDELVLRLDL